MIKKLFILPFMVMGYLSNAQCDKSIMLITDELGGTSNWSSTENIVFSEDGKTGMIHYLLLSVDKKSLIWVNSTTEIGCIDEKTKIDILFTDDTRITLYSDGKFNCKGKATVYFGHVFGRRKEAADLSTKQIKMIRINAGNSHTETVKEESALLFNEAFKCLLEKQNER
jgi:hypothetical protein